MSYSFSLRKIQITNIPSKQLRKPINLIVSVILSIFFSTHLYAQVRTNRLFQG